MADRQSTRENVISLEGCKSGGSRLVGDARESSIVRDCAVPPAGLAERLERRRYSCDESAFDETGELAEYFLGFLITDGCNFRQEKLDGSAGLSLVRLALVGDASKVIIERFKTFLRATHPIHSRRKENGKYIHYMDIFSKKLSEAVASYGVVPRKTPTAEFRRGLHESRHAWRGCLDGDGCINISRSRDTVCAFLCGAPPLVTQFKAFVDVNIGPSRGAIRYMTPTFCEYRLHGDRACGLLRLLYGNCDIALKREKAWEAIRFWQGEEGLDPRRMPGGDKFDTPLPLPKRKHGWGSGKKKPAWSGKWKDWSSVSLEDVMERRHRLKTLAGVAGEMGVTLHQLQGFLARERKRRKGES